MEHFVHRRAHPEIFFPEFSWLQSCVFFCTIYSFQRLLGHLPETPELVAPSCLNIIQDGLVGATKIIELGTRIDMDWRRSKSFLMEWHIDPHGMTTSVGVDWHLLMSINVDKSMSIDIDWNGLMSIEVDCMTPTDANWSNRITSIDIDWCRFRDVDWSPRN